MQTPNGRNIDNYYNRFDKSKGYKEILFRDGYGTQASEINELESIVSTRMQKMGDALFKDGDVIRDAQITVDPVSGAVRAQAGLVYLAGDVWDVAEASFIIPARGTVSVGVRLEETIVSELEDPALNNPAVGSRGEGEPGAWRRKVVASWGYEGDGKDGDFYPVHTVDDGIPRAKETPPNLDSFTQGIARYDRDSTGGGTYVCAGLTVRAAEDSNGKQVYTVAEGRCRVSGYGVELLTSRRIAYDAQPDLRFVDTEVHTGNGAASQRITVAHPPIKNISALRVTLRKTVSVVHGSYSGCADALPDTSILSLVEVKQGETVYSAGDDYRRTGDTVDWAPSGNEPATGSTYTVTYTYLDSTVSPESVDFDGFTVSNAVEGSSIMVSYNQALPRVDRLCINTDGVFSWVQGVAAEKNAKAPIVPDTLLALASVTQTWRTPEERIVTNDGVRVVPFSDIETLSSRIDYAIAEIARQRLASDVSTREAGAKVGMFVDPLLDDSMRDQGIEQNAAVVNGFLTLPILASAHSLSADVATPTARNYVPAAILSQPYRTGEMKVNPYLAFDILPGKATLTPAVDRWTEKRSVWTSPVTQVFNTAVYAPGHPQHGQTLTSSSVSTQTVGTAASAIEYLRCIDVSFVLEGFGEGESLASITFDGIAVPAKGSVAPADANGIMRGVFTIPANVPAGSKAVVFRSSGGKTASATFVGQGTLEVSTLRSVQTVTNTLIDPLAQTFVLENDAQIAGIDLWFTAKGGDVRVQIREVSNGVPTRTVLAEKEVKIADIVVTGGGHTRVLFDAPLGASAGVEYAMVILADDADTALAVAEMGQYDKLQKQWVAAQPYTVGVLLSSSNASTWTAHQTKDLAFRLLGAQYGSSDGVITLGTADVGEGVTDVMLYALSETPTSGARVEYTLTMPDNTEIVVAEEQPIRLAAAAAGAVKVTARLIGSDTGGPVLWPGSQIVAGVLAQTANYYTRTIAASGASKAMLVYSASIPTGATVTPEIQIDGGEWQAVESLGAVPQGDGYAEYTFGKTLRGADTVKVRMTLTGSLAARPNVYDIRLVAIV